MASKYVTIKIPTSTEQHKRKWAGDYLGFEISRWSTEGRKESGQPRMAEHH